MEVTREEMLEFAKQATFHLDDRLVPYDRETLRAEAWLMGYEFAKKYADKKKSILDENGAIVKEVNKAVRPITYTYKGEAGSLEEAIKKEGNVYRIGDDFHGFLNGKWRKAECLEVWNDETLRFEERRVFPMED